MPAGRPTLYEERYCEEIVVFMGQGYSKTAFAGHIGVCHDTIIEWSARHPEFSDAVKAGQAARTKKLEETLIAGETGPKVTAHIFALKNAAPAEWKDRVIQEHSGPNGGAIPVRFDLSGLTDEELDELEKLRSRIAVAGGNQGGEGQASG
jgi:hypothetical protein